MALADDQSRRTLIYVYCNVCARLHGVKVLFVVVWCAGVAHITHHHISAQTMGPLFLSRAAARRCTQTKPHTHARTHAFASVMSARI